MYLQRGSERRRQVKTKQPLAVYGHKNPWMLVCFLACVKSGHGYCPIDISVPQMRGLQMILQALPSGGPVLTTEDMQVDAGNKAVYLTLEEIRKHWRGQRTVMHLPETDVGDLEMIPGTSSSHPAVPARRREFRFRRTAFHHYLDWSVGLGICTRRKRKDRCFSIRHHFHLICQ